MIKVLINIIIWFAGTDTARELGNRARNKILNSANDRIKNEDVSKFLDDAIKSNGNTLDVVMLNDIKKVTKSPELKSLLTDVVENIAKGK